MKLELKSGNTVLFDKNELDIGDGESKTLHSFNMVGYTGAVMSSMFGNVVINLQGMTTRNDQTPIFQHHDRTRIVGHGKATIGNDVKLAGVISGTGEAAQEVLSTSENGFPWQASVGIDIQKVIELDMDEVLTVNGQEVKGPAVVFDKSELFETSFVPLGRDGETSAVVFSEDAEDALKHLCAATKTKEEHENMSEKDKQEKVENSAEVLEAAKQEASQATAEHLKSLLAEFSRDTAMKAFEAGKSVDDVKVEEYDKLKTRCEELQAEVDELKSKKQAEGEEKPVEFSEEEPVEGNPKELFDAKVSEFREKGLGAGDAFRAAMKENPELAEQAYKKGVR
jgi:cell division protein FtsB